MWTSRSSVYFWTICLVFFLQFLYALPLDSSCADSILYYDDCIALKELFYPSQECYIYPKSWNLSSDPCSRNDVVQCNQVDDHSGKLTITYLNVEENLTAQFACRSNPQAIGSFKNLTYLALSYYPLNTSLISFSNLQNLKNLTLARNALMLVHDDIGYLAKLQHLDLSGNILTTFPDSFINLGNLLFLNLSRNLLIGEIPIFIRELTNLSSLDLANNLLENPIPGWLRRLKKLQYLNLEDNNFSGPLPKYFKDIKEVYIAGNRFCSVCTSMPLLLLWTIIGTSTSAVLFTICMGVMFWHIQRRRNRRWEGIERMVLEMEPIEDPKADEATESMDSRMLVPVHFEGKVIGMASEIPEGSSKRWENESSSTSSDEEQSAAKASVSMSRSE